MSIKRSFHPILFILIIGCGGAKRECIFKDEPPLPDVERIIVEQNPPGNEDRIIGLSGAVSSNCKVLLFADITLSIQITSTVADKEGGFSPLSIGDNLYAEVYLLVEDKMGKKSLYIVLQNDIFPPETEITEFPSNPTEMTSTTFRFSCSEDECAFECKIDNEEWERCSSPKTYFLKGGNHRFDVMAIDEAGNKDYSPASYEWRIEPPFPGSLLWTFSQIEKMPERVGEGYAPSPAFGDIDGDGKLEVVVAPYNVVHAINGEDGSLLWSYPIPFSYPILSPLLADIDGDGRLEVVISGDKIYALNGEDGSLLWVYDSEDWVIFSHSIGELDKDGKLEVVAGDFYGLYALNGEDGSLLWSYDISVVCWWYTVSIGDINGDGKLEVVADCLYLEEEESEIFVINGENGSLLWTLSLPDWSYQVLGDINGDGRPEVIIDSGDTTYALNGEDGSILWVYKDGGDIGFLSLGDIDGDGRVEVVTIGGDKRVYAINGEDGSLLWVSERMIDSIIGTLIGDINGDGKLEVLVSLLNFIYALSGGDGSLLWDTYRDEIIPCCLDMPSLTDINGDGIIDMISYSEYYLNKKFPTLYAFSLNAPLPPPDLLPWPMERHDVKRTGLYTGNPYPPW